MYGGLEEALEGLQVHLLVPDLWQQEAIRALRESQDVIVSAPTGAGKTLVFETLVNEGKGLGPDRQAVYTVPTRALANDKWREWKRAGWNVGIATGDLAENLDAPVIVATLETQRERFLSGDGPALLVIDEYQMIGDRRRGLHYELAIALAPPETRLLLLSGSVDNPKKVCEWLTRLGRPARVVETKERPVPLDEIPVQAMPRAAPRKCRNLWQRLALSTLLSNYGPLLIFTPHRKAAEKIAWKIAEALPDDDPIRFGDKRLEQCCSRDLSRLLAKRVAFHHSGLGFAERAAIIEPLAKAGQLRVIVATMGLAAGINFSVRSVFIAGTHFQEGPFERDVSPSEMLQMYGRAGRRGLDQIGFVIVGDHSPRLMEAHPLELRRQNELDWPTLIRRMHHAAEAGESPFTAARDLTLRLFSQQKIALGFRSKGTRGEIDPGGLFGIKPTRKEIQNASGEWEAIHLGKESKACLGDTLRFVRGRYRKAEGDSSLISSLLPQRARLCRIDAKGSGPKRYGLEIAIGTESSSGSTFHLTKYARQLVGAKRGDAEFSLAETKAFLPEVFYAAIAPGKFEAIIQRGRTLYLTGHFRETELHVYLDSAGHSLHKPQTRHADIAAETHYTDEVSGELREPAAGTAAHAWRKLRLIDDQGRPTPRGVLFSLFQRGEGLAIAAALEDPHYPADELIFHLANLRAGHRFELDSVPQSYQRIDSIGSERLAAACRQAYGAVDFEGYLHLGLPIDYGEGAAEVMTLMMEGGLHKLTAHASKLEFGAGDVERAYVEWLSLLRHIHHAPTLEDPRWKELKAIAAEELKKRDRRSPLIDLPELPTSVLQKSPQHGIRFSSL